MCKNHATQCTTFTLVLNNVKNIPLSENIVVVCVSITRFLPPTSASIRRYRQLDDKGWSLDYNNMGRISYSIQHRELALHSFNSF